MDTFEAETEIDVAAIQVQIDALEQELAAVQGQLGQYLSELGYVVPGDVVGDRIPNLHPGAISTSEDFDEPLI